MENQPTKTGNRGARKILAFIWLTVGYWVVSFIVPFAWLLLPVVDASGGITETTHDGVHTVSFSGRPGDIVALLITTTSGHKQVTLAEAPDSASGSTTHLEWANGYYELFSVVVFALLSVPVLGRLLRDDRKASPGEAAHSP